MTINNPHLLTKLEIWAPRYSDAYVGDGERVVLLAKYKVAQSSPIILIEFTKAKHLLGQRFCVSRDDVLKCQVNNNGKIPCYAVPMSKLETWQTAAEVHDIAMKVFE